MLRHNSSYRPNQSQISPNNNKSQSSSLESTICHAHTAANLAFSRATGQVSSMMLDFSNDNRSPRDIIKENNQINTHPSRPEIKSQDSVRFVGPCVIKQSKSTSAKSPSIILPTNKARPIQTGTKNHATTECGILSHSPSADRISSLESITKSHTTAGINHKYRKNGKRLSSTKLSYRHIRKSKSMFIPQKNPDVFYTNGIPETPYENYTSGSLAFQNRQSRSPKIGLKVSKSTNFVHAKTHDNEINDTAVRLARDRLLNEATQQKLKEKPPHLFRSKPHKPKKSYQDSLRKFSGDSETSKVISSEISQNFRVKDSRLREFATKASRLFKSRLRKRFGRGFDNTFEVPAQQVDASKTHVRTYNGDSASEYSNKLLASHFNEASFARVVTRIPSIYEAAPSGMRSQVGSIKSVKSYTTDEKSAVTSWNSTAVNTVNSHDSLKYQSKGDPNSNIINKYETQNPQTSPSVCRNKNEAFNLSRLEKPAGCNPDPNAISSARVYSALMKRLDAKNSRHRFKPSQRYSTTSVSSPENPDRSKLFDTKNGESKTNTTIKQISSEETVSEREICCKSQERGVPFVISDSEKIALKNSDGFADSNPNFFEASILGGEPVIKDGINYLKRKPSNDQINSPIEILKSEEKIPSLSFTIPKEKETHETNRHSTEKFDMTTQETSQDNGYLLSDTNTLRQRKSTFFGGGTVPIVKTTSPLRRAMAEGLCKPNNISSTKQDEAKRRKSDSLYSESIYSCTTSGQARNINNSEWSLSSKNSEKESKMLSSSNSTESDVKIIEQAMCTPKPPPKSRERLLLCKNSNEWRSWMSSEISKFEREKENRHSWNGNYAVLPKKPHLSHTSHTREEAQITSDDLEISHQNSIVSIEPLCIVQQNQNIRNSQLFRPAQNKKSSISFEKPRSQSRFLVSPHNTPASLLGTETCLSNTQPISLLRSKASINAPNLFIRKPDTSKENSTHKEIIPQSNMHPNKSYTDIEYDGNLIIPDKNKSSQISRTHGSVTDNFDALSFTKKSAKLSCGDSRPNSDKDLESSDNWEQDLNPLKISGTINSWPLDLNKVDNKEAIEFFLTKRRKRFATASEDTGSLFL